MKTMIRTQRPSSLAQGHFHGGNRRIAVAFADPMFEKIRDMAASREVTFGEMVRRLISRALRETQ